VQLLEFVKGFRLLLPPEAIELLTVEANDVAEIAAPAENGSKDVVKFGELHVIGDRDQADHHRAHFMQNCSQNQAFEWGWFKHAPRLLGLSQIPDFLVHSTPGCNARFAGASPRVPRRRLLMDAQALENVFIAPVMRSHGQPRRREGLSLSLSRCHCDHDFHAIAGSEGQSGPIAQIQ